MTDIVEGKPEGLALDINQSRSIEGFETKVVGQTTGANGEGYEAIAGSDVVVITAGLPRKPGMSRMDLIEVNAGIVRGVAENIAKHAPNAVVIVVSNPLDEMTALTQLATGFPKARVIGQAGMLDTALVLSPAAKLAWMFVGGLFVGFGTRMANGCTSGHGIFGLSNFEWPSLVATLCFMGTGLVTTQVLYRLVLR